MPLKYLYFLWLFFLLHGTSAFAQGRGVFFDEIHNVRPLFTVRVNVNQPDRVYAKDELLRVTVTSSENGYLYLFYCEAEGNVAMLYPNRFNKKSTILKSEPITVPPPDGIYQIRMDAPFGEELLTAVVSKKKLEFFENLDLTGINMLPISEKEGQELVASLKAMATSDWATNHVRFRTVDPDAPKNAVVPSLVRKTRSFPLQRLILRLRNVRG